MRYDVAILGAGPAGIAAAFSLARGGKKVAVVENRQAGGTCLNRGCIPTKMLLGGIAPLELVLALKKQKVLSGEVGVDFKALRTRMDRFVKGSSQMVEKNLVALGVDFIRGTASLESPGVVAVSCEDGAKSLEAEDIILACGSRNAAFPGMEPDGDCVLNSTSLLAIETIPSSLLVIGAGAIGLEMGHFFAAMGSKVTIVEGAAHIAPLEDADIADELRKTLKKRGIACVEGVFAKSLVTKDGQCIRFHETDVRSTGRVSMGVRGMNLSDNDEVIGMQMSSQGKDLLIVSEKGMGKRTSMDEFTRQNRGGKGVKCYKITEKTGYVVGMKAVDDDSEIMIINTEGIVIRMKCEDISVYGRITSGVKLINLSENDIVASVAKVRKASAEIDGEQVEIKEETEEESEK